MNIALIHDGAPVLGVIYVPVGGQLYFAMEGSAYATRGPISADHASMDYQTLLDGSIPLPDAAKSGRPYTVVGSRSHCSPETEAYIEQIKNEHKHLAFVSMGSSLKLCLIARGMADIYPRFGPTMEWDTAAGHAIVRGAGGSLVDAISGCELRYNKENLINPHFIARRDYNNLW